MKVFPVLLLVIVECVRNKRVSATSSSPMTTQLCSSPTEIFLQPNGSASSVIIDLDVPENVPKLCKLRVYAPDTHVINMEWKEDNQELIENHSRTTPPCILNVFLSQNKSTPVWKGDPCARSPLPESDLFTSQVRLVWDPPRYGFHAKGRKLVLTAVGQGEVCKEPGQHTCMRIGWQPILCISDQLVCDGYRNCPRRTTTSDEDDNLCRSHMMGATSWDQLAAEIFRKLPAGMKPNKWIDDPPKDQPSTEFPHMLQINWDAPRRIEWTTTGSGIILRENGPDDSMSTTLAHYGPWGYLLLGMLFCGTVLMFCGLWECCFRKPKPRNEIQMQSQPSAVLIINQSQEERAGMAPPNYDDLDQPPSYTALFPHCKAEEVECVVVIDSRTPMVRAGRSNGSVAVAVEVEEEEEREGMMAGVGGDETVIEAVGEEAGVGQQLLNGSPLEGD